MFSMFSFIFLEIIIIILILREIISRTVVFHFPLKLSMYIYFLKPSIVNQTASGSPVHNLHFLFFFFSFFLVMKQVVGVVLEVLIVVSRFTPATPWMITRQELLNHLLLFKNIMNMPLTLLSVKCVCLCVNVYVFFLDEPSIPLRNRSLSCIFDGHVLRLPSWFYFHFTQYIASLYREI